MQTALEKDKMTASVRNHCLVVLLYLTTTIFIKECFSRDYIQDNFLLVVANYQGARNIYQIDLESGAMIQLLTTNISGLAALAFDPMHWIVYWTAIGEGLIGKTSFKGSYERSTIIFENPNGILQLAGLALDIENGKLYYSDAGNSPKIVEMNLDGSQPDPIYTESGMKPRALVLDTEHRDLYCTDWGARPGIYLIDLGTRQRRTILTDNFTWPNALAIDFEERVMYFADAYTYRIEMAKLDGSGRVTLVTETNAHYFAMALSPQYLYITDWNTSAVRKLDRTTHKLSEQEPKVFGKQLGIVYYNSSFWRGLPTASPTNTPTTTNSTTAIFPYLASSNSAVVIIIAVCAGGGGAVLVVVIVIVVAVIFSRNNKRKMLDASNISEQQSADNKYHSNALDTHISTDGSHIYDEISGNEGSYEGIQSYERCYEPIQCSRGQALNEIKSGGYKQ